MSSVKSPLTERLNEELAAVRTELTRLDGKCSTLAGLSGAALVFVAARVAGHGPMLAKVPLVVSGVALAAAAVVLLATVLRPRFGPTGFNRYAVMTATQIRTLLESSAGDEDTDRARDLNILSGIARTKNRRLRMAVDLIITAVVLIALGMCIGAL
jgi:xanthine/uracil permease